MSTIQLANRSTVLLSMPVVRRFVWKELRRMRGFAAGVALLTLLAMLFALAIAPPSELQEMRGFVQFIAFGGAAFVAIGATITAYSVEREEQTDAFLYSLPRYWMATFAGKLLATLLLALVFAAGMAFVGWCVAGGQWPNAAHQEIVYSGITLIVEATAWGMLLSMLISRPLLAAVLACAATSFSSQVAMAISGGNGFHSNDYYTSIPHRLAIAAIVLVVSAIVARRWMLGSLGSPAMLGRSRKQSTDASTVAPQSALHLASPRREQPTLLPIVPPTTQGILLRLAWQTLRETWRSMLGAVGVGLLLMVALQGVLADWWGVAGGYMAINLLILPGLCGALTFRCDQRRNQYRFLAEHAGRPRLVWLVRISTWALYLAALLVPLVKVVLLLGSRHLTRPLVDANLSSQWTTSSSAVLQSNFADLLYYGVYAFGLIAFTTFAVGQLASLLLKSEILAGGVAMLASIVLLWYGYLIVAWRLPPGWCLVPIMLGMLIASYLRMPDWLVGRHTPWRWACVVLAMVLPTAAVVASIPLIRQVQIDSALDQSRALTHSNTNSFSAEVINYKLKLNAAKDVAQEYQAIVDRVLDSDEPLEANEIALSNATIAEQAGAHLNEIQELCDLTQQPAASADIGAGWVPSVYMLLETDFKRALKAGDLDTAFNRYASMVRLQVQLLHSYNPSAHHSRPQGNTPPRPDLLVDWATAPGQTALRIKSAIDQLAAVEQHFPQLHHFVISQYLNALRVLEGKDTLSPQSNATPIDVAYSLDSFTNEHQRAEQALELLATLSVDYALHTASLVGEPLRNQIEPHFYPDRSKIALLQNNIGEARFRHRLRQTAKSSLLAGLIWDSAGDINSRIRDQLLQTTELRIERLLLALIGYHLDHGEYPLTLHMLVPNYTNAIPTDPFSGEAFQYSPRGFAPPLAHLGQWQSSPFGDRIEANVPVIWSVGPGNVSPKELWFRVPQTESPQTESDVENDQEPESELITTFVPTAYPGQHPTVVAPLPTPEAYPE